MCVAHEEMQKAVKDALDQEDRSRHVMFFGLPETVTQFFEELVVAVCRIGRKSTTSRPS